MANADLRVDRDGDGASLAVSGEIDLAFAPTLEREALELVAEGVAALTLDLSGVEFMDSTGLRAVLTVRDAAIDAGGGLLVLRPSPSVQRLLDVSGLTGRIEIQP